MGPRYLSAYILKEVRNLPPESFSGRRTGEIGLLATREKMARVRTLFI